MTLHATCFAGMLFGWETVMTFVLVSVVYAVAVGEPSFGNVGPYAVGLSLFAMVFAGKWQCPLLQGDHSSPVLYAKLCIIVLAASQLLKLVI